MSWRKSVTCETCIYFCNRLKGPELLPDKTVIRHPSVFWCTRGDFELKDLQPCELHEKPQYDPIPY